MIVATRGQLLRSSSLILISCTLTLVARTLIVPIATLAATFPAIGAPPAAIRKKVLWDHSASIASLLDPSLDYNHKMDLLQEAFQLH